MLGVKEGKTEKLGLLYERYKKWLFNFFYQMDRDADLSEDLVQNVFVRILKYKHTYTEESKFVSWMFHIARNVHHDHFRKNAKHVHLELEEVAYRISNTADIEQVIAEKEEAKILSDALRYLPVDKREVLVLSKLKEMKYKEVGTILGCTEDAARTKAHRALKELKNVFMTLQN